MSETTDYGHFALGSSPTFIFVFQQKIMGVWTNANPGVAPVLNVTLDGVKTAKSLTNTAAGTYTWTPLLTVPGFYTGTVYAPSGSGQASFPFSFAVDPDSNYP